MSEICASYRSPKILGSSCTARTPGGMDYPSSKCKLPLLFHHCPSPNSVIATSILTFTAPFPIRFEARSRPFANIKLNYCRYQTSNLSLVSPPTCLQPQPESLRYKIQSDLSLNDPVTAINRIQKAISTQTEFPSPVLPYRHYHDLVQHCSDAENWQLALQALQLLEKSGFYAKRSTTSLVLRALCRAGRVIEAEKLLLQLSCDNVVLADGTERKLTEEEQERRCCDERMVRTVALCAIDITRSEVAVRLIKAYGVRSEHLRSILIKAYGRLGNAAGVERTLGEGGGVVICNSAIDAYVRCGEGGKAMKVLRRMENPNARSFNAVLRGLGKAGKLEEAERLWREMESKKIEWTKATYNAMVCCYVRAGKWSKVAQMVQGGGLEAVTSVMDGLVKEGDVEEAMKIWESVGEIEEGGIVGVIVGGMFGMGKVEEGMRIFKGVSTKSGDLYCAVVSALVKIGRLGEARGVVEEMNGVGVKFKTRAFNILLEGTVKGPGDMKAAEKIFQEMEEKGVVRTVVTYTTLLQGYAKRKDLKGARAMFKKMKREVGVDRVAANAMLGALVHAGYVEEGIGLFEEMQRVGGGLRPDLVTFSAVIAGLVRAGRTTDAWEYYEEMKGMEIVPNERLLERMMAALVNPQIKKGQGVELVVREGWISQRAAVLLADMERCRVSKANRDRWNRALRRVRT